MIQVTSRDMEAAIRLHKKYPGMIKKTFPTTAREETKQFRSSIKRRAISNNWPRALKWGRSTFAMDTTLQKTKKITKYKEIGIRMEPKFMGPTVLFELGSKGKRFPRNKPQFYYASRHTGVLKGKPAYGPEWISFRASGKNKIQSSFIKATDRLMNSAIRKAGLK